MEDGTAHTEHCILCNRKICRWLHHSAHIPHQSSYLGSFRIVFTTPESRWEEAHLSGVAPYRDWLVGVPGYTSASNRPTHYWRQYVDPAHWRVARNFAFFQDYERSWSQRNIIWVFPFHSRCWQTLEMAAYTLKIPLDIQAVYDVAMTFHFEDTIRNNHSMLAINERASRINFLPPSSLAPPLGPTLAEAERDRVHASFDSFTPARGDNWHFDPRTPAQDNNSHFDPRSWHTIQKMERRIERARSKSDPVGRGVFLKSTHTQAKTLHDPFSKFPPEILESIFTELPLGDLFRLRISSRSCAAVTLSASFFRSSLNPRGLLGYVIELTKLNEELRPGWSDIFAQALNLSKIQGLEYRKTNWSAAIDLMDLVRLRLEAPLCLGSEGYHRSLMQHCPPRSTMHFNNGKAPPREEWSDDYPGEDPSLTTIRKARWLEICKPLEKVSISTMELHERQFVTGLSFHFEDGTSSQIGYIHLETLVTAWTSKDACNKRINYMTVTLDSMGVRGIKIGCKGSPVWVGDDEGDGIERRRLRLRSYTARDEPRYAGRFIEADFDNLKMQHIQ